MRLLAIVVVVLASAMDFSAAPGQSPAGQSAAAPAVTAAAPALARDPNLPPSEQEAKAALEKSPRHGEFVDVPMPSGGPVKAWIVYPERLRAQAEGNGANLKATREAWPRTIAFLREKLK